jgi:hypothetical protein
MYEDNGTQEKRCVRVLRVRQQMVSVSESSPLLALRPLPNIELSSDPKEKKYFLQICFVIKNSTIFWETIYMV